MTSPVSAIEAIEKAPNRIQGMVRSIDQYRNGDPKAIADGSHAQVLYALTDYKHDILVLWDFAVAAGRQAEALTGIGSAHDLISDWLGEGTDDLPDETPVRIEIGKRTIIIDSLGSLRRARALLGGSENAE